MSVFKIFGRFIALKSEKVLIQNFYENFVGNVAKTKTKEIDFGNKIEVVHKTINKKGDRHKSQMQNFAFMAVK